MQNKLDLDLLSEFDFILGIDEVGRGCWAGPVTVGGCLISKDSVILNEVNDSKVISKKKRENIYDKRNDIGIKYFIANRSNLRIDEFGIVQCIRECVVEILSKISTPNTLVLLDGYFKDFDLSNSNLEFRQIIDGDAKCYSIALASIIAKVDRDSQMQNLDKRYPGYGFDKNAGYGTSRHLQGLKELGICDIHRRSFKPIKNL